MTKSIKLKGILDNDGKRWLSYEEVLEAFSYVADVEHEAGVYKGKTLGLKAGIMIGSIAGLLLAVVVVAFAKL